MAAEDQVLAILASNASVAPSIVWKLSLCSKWCFARLFDLGAFRNVHLPHHTLSVDDAVKRFGTQLECLVVPFTVYAHNAYTTRPCSPRFHLRVAHLIVSPPLRVVPPPLRVTTGHVVIETATEDTVAYTHRVICSQNGQPVDVVIEGLHTIVSPTLLTGLQLIGFVDNVRTLCMRSSTKYGTLNDHFLGLLDWCCGGVMKELHLHHGFADDRTPVVLKRLRDAPEHFPNLETLTVGGPLNGEWSAFTPSIVAAACAARTLKTLTLCCFSWTDDAHLRFAGFPTSKVHTLVLDNWIDPWADLPVSTAFLKTVDNVLLHCASLKHFKLVLHTRYEESVVENSVREAFATRPDIQVRIDFK